MKSALLTVIMVAVVTALFGGCENESPVQGALAEVSTSAASNITATSVEIGGNVTKDGGSAIKERGVVWANHASPMLTDSIAKSGSGMGAFSITLSGLNANTMYYVRAYAVNSSGTAYGNEVSLTTSVGLATVTTTPASNIQPLSAESGGNVINDGGAPVTERGVVYATNPEPTTSDNKLASGSGTGSFALTLSPLASQTTYYVRAYAINAFGTAYGSQIQFTAASANTVTDIDGNVYPYITIGGQMWMTVNLKTTRYRNGGPITDGSAPSFDWVNNTAGAYTYPNGDPANNNQYGKLYNFAAVRDSQGICPTGWHVATDTNWADLEISLGMDPGIVFTTGTRLCPNAPTILEGGSSGLEMKKGGELFVDFFGGPTFYNAFGTRGIYWTGTQSTATSNRQRILNRDDDPTLIYRATSGRASLKSVRCVKD